ncbi:hypothetical protein K3495_g6009 [Podosphaera aphanis]|nr:hypothetical protein K3495_g6009 [Podosphaera aphanis]
MEAVNGNQNFSNIWCTNNTEKAEYSTQHHQKPSTNMAAAAVAVNQSYSYPSKFPRHEVMSSMSVERSSSLHSLLSPTESRRASYPQDELSQTHSQNCLSLPSIREALASEPTTYPSPVPVAVPPSHKRPLPRPQSPSVPSVFPSPDQVPFSTKRKRTPQSFNTKSNQFSWPLEPCNAALPNSLTHISAPVTHMSYEPRLKVSTYEQEPRELPILYPNHLSHPKPHQITDARGRDTLTPSVLSTSHLPPLSSQRSFSARDIDEPREFRKDIIDDEEKLDIAQNFRGGLKRNLDVWDFENNLAEINFSSSALQEWSATYDAIAMSKQPHVNAVWDRMPSLDSILEMKKHQEKISSCLEHMRRIIKEAKQQIERSVVEQRSQDLNSRSTDYDEETTSIYNDDSKNHSYSSEAKKRRGRAAPPGRCHSCNRAETPEWRRGPDGARTLCNACGLHYAKLTRKSTVNKAQSASYSTSLPSKSHDVIPKTL